jgi:TetR/AcrR family transcriptional repressor of nem operon
MSTKKEIIRKGVDLFREQGYNNTGINDILKTCDISKGSFYNYFRTKEGYGIKVIDYYGDTLLEYMIGKLRSGDGSPVEKLEALYNSFIEIVEREEIKSGCLVSNISNEMGGVNDRLAEVADQNFRKWIDEIARIVAKGQALKEIRNDMEALKIAEYIHASFFGSLSRMKVTRNTDSLKDWLNMTLKFIKVDNG